MNLLRCGWRQTQTLIVPRLRVLQRRSFRCPLTVIDIDITLLRAGHTISLVGRIPHFQYPFGTHPFQDYSQLSQPP